MRRTPNPEAARLAFLTAEHAALNQSLLSRRRARARAQTMSPEAIRAELRAWREKARQHA